MTVPAALVYAPPAMEYCAFVPPLIEIGDGALMPPTVMLFDVITVYVALSVCAVKLNAFGMVSVVDARAVTENAPFTPPMVSVTVVVALFDADEV